MKLALSVFFAIMWLLPLPATAQDLQSLVENIEKNVKSVEPEWKLHSKRYEENACIVSWVHSQKTGEEYLAIINSASSEKLAADKLAKSTSVSSTGDPGEKLPGIGEEAYLFRGKSGRSVSIYFRRQNIVIKLLAPSELKAKGLAKLLADSISTKGAQPSKENQKRN